MANEITNVMLLLALLRKILVENPSQRATVTAICRHQWFTKVYTKDTGAHAFVTSQLIVLP